MAPQLKSFSNTTIAVSKTQENLEAVLARRDIGASRWTHYAPSGDAPGSMRFEFEWSRPGRLAPLGFRIEVEYKPEVGPYGGKRGTTREQAARAIYWHVKNLFDAVDFGIVDVEQAFMPYLMLPEGVTAYERMKPELDALPPGAIPRLLTAGK